MPTKQKKTGGQADEPYRLVYSTDPMPQRARHEEQPQVVPLRPSVRLERKGRNGKTVTVLFKLPVDENVLKPLCAHLKRALGCGGTYQSGGDSGIIEIQGDHRDTILPLVERYAATLAK